MARDMKTERRRRDTDGLGGNRRRLAVNMESLDTENFTYRWVNDVPGRIYEFTVRDDWEVVTDRDAGLKPETSSLGSQVTHRAGTGDGGAPVGAILLRKPKAYHDADAAVRQRQIDEQEAGLKAGAVPGAGGSDKTYTPSESIRIGHGDR